MSARALPAPERMARAGAWRRARGRLDLVVATPVVVLFAAAATSTDGFLSAANLKAILGSMAILGVVAAGMTCITVAGSLFSLTLGTTVTVTTMTFLGALTFGIVPAIGLTVACGALVCGIQGLAIGGLGANPIIVTIAFGALQLGIAGRLTHESTVYPPSHVDLSFLTTPVGGLPVSFFVMLVVVAVLELWLRRTRLGCETYLAGENRLAARASALRVTRVTVSVFAIAGACAGVAGILIGAAEGNATLLSGGDRYTYDAIAAVLVGGTMASGGHGSPVRTAIGAFVIAAISDLLLLRDYTQGVQALVTGAVVLLVIVVSQLGKGRRR